MHINTNTYNRNEMKRSENRKKKQIKMMHTILFRSRMRHIAASIQHQKYHRLICAIVQHSCFLSLSVFNSHIYLNESQMQ